MDIAEMIARLRTDPDSALAELGTTTLPAPLGALVSLALAPGRDSLDRLCGEIPAKLPDPEVVLLQAILDTWPEEVQAEPRYYTPPAAYRLVRSLKVERSRDFIADLQQLGGWRVRHLWLQHDDAVDDYAYEAWPILVADPHLETLHHLTLDDAHDGMVRSFIEAGRIHGLVHLTLHPEGDPVRHDKRGAVGSSAAATIAAQGALPHLRTLEIPHGRLGDEGVAALATARFAEALEVLGLRGNGARVWAPLLQRLSAAHSLDLRDNLLDDASLAALTGLAALRTLRVGPVGEGARLVAALPAGIESLHLDGVDGATLRALAVAPVASSLRSLDVSTPLDHDYETELDDPAALGALALPNLERLALRHDATAESIDQLVALAAAAPRLTHVDAGLVFDELATTLRASLPDRVTLDVSS